MSRCLPTQRRRLAADRRVALCRSQQVLKLDEKAGLWVREVYALEKWASPLPTTRECLYSKIASHIELLHFADTLYAP